MKKTPANYGNDSISSLKGADRVRKRPAVIFGSDGLDGCKHSFFEIFSNSIDEAREGYGNTIVVTRFLDNSLQVEDFGRGCPVDWNEAENRFNWELVFCEMYAGGKYRNNYDGAEYEFSLGLNGLGLCATQYSSEYMDVEIYRDSKKYTLHFEKGINVGGLGVELYDGERTGTVIKWKPDLEVFTEINISEDFFLNTLKRQAVVNAGVSLQYRQELEGGEFTDERVSVASVPPTILDEGVAAEFVSDTFDEDMLSEGSEDASENMEDADEGEDTSDDEEASESAFDVSASVKAALSKKFIADVPRRIENGFNVAEFVYPAGISGYVDEIGNGGMLTKPVFIETERTGRDRSDRPEYKVKLTAAFAFSNRVNTVEHYHNSSYLEHGGSPDKAARIAFVAELDSYLRKNNKYSKSDSKITYADVQDSLILVTNCFSTQTSYENQTKKAITNKFVQEAMTEFLRSRLSIYLIENAVEAEKIAEQVLLNKRSRETAERAKFNIKKKLLGGIDGVNRVQKFVDCRSKDLKRRELYIVEGDSALGACKLSRDADFQGIIPVRGKILNCLKADYGKIFSNEIITDLMKVLGCGVEIQNKHSRDMSAFDLSALRWSKIIICTDADVDGFQIRALILTMLYRLVPTLVENGFVYIAESPLFEIECKGKTYFAYSEKQKADIVAGFEGAKHVIHRSKGLGENDPDMMWMTTMNPATRRLIKVHVKDAEAALAAFDLFLGANLAGRKEFISEHGHRFIDAADIS